MFKDIRNPKFSLIVYLVSISLGACLGLLVTNFYQTSHIRFLVASVVVVPIILCNLKSRSQDPVILSLCSLVGYLFISLFWQDDWAVGDVFKLINWLIIVSVILATKIVMLRLTILEVEKTFIAVVVFCSVFVSLVGISQAYAVIDIPYTSQAFPGSTFSNRNFASSFVAMCLPFAVWQGFFAKQSALRVLLYTVALMSMIGFLSICKTRGVLLALVVAPIVCWFVSRFYSLSFSRYFILNSFIPIGRVTFLIIIAVCFWNISPIDGKSLSKDLSVDNSVQYRLEAWADSVSASKESLIFGRGIGSYRETLYEEMNGSRIRNAVNEDRQMQHAHNEFIELLVEGGLIGLGIFLFFIYFLIARFKAANSPFVFVLFIACLIPIIHSVFSFPLHYGGTAIMIAIMIGTYLFSTVEGNKSASVESSPKKFNRLNLSMNLCLMLGLLMSVVFLVIMLIHGEKLGKVYHSGEKSINCEAVRNSDLEFSSFWLEDYRAKVMYVYSLKVCNDYSKDSYELVYKLYQSDPTFIRGGLYLSWVEWKFGFLNDAKKRLYSIVEHHPELVEPWLLLADIAFKEDNREQVISFLKAAKTSGNKTLLIKEKASELNVEL